MDNTGPLLQPVPSPAWANFSFLSLFLSLVEEIEKPEKPRRRDREVSRPRKESGVDIARGDTRLVETSRGGEKKKKRKEARLGLRARA